MVLCVVSFNGEDSKFSTGVRQLKFRMFLTELRGYVHLCAVGFLYKSLVVPVKLFRYFEF